MKKFVAAGARRLRDLLSRAGIDIRTVRGRNHWRAGLELIWHKFDQKTVRSVISQVDSFGPTVHFLVADQKDYIQSHFLSGHFYAEEELKVIRRYYQGGTFLDVGANVGNHSLFAARVLEAPRVIAIEPFPQAYRLLRCNIALNDAQETVIHHAVALSSENRTATMEAAEGNLGLAVVREGDGSIPVRIGDELIGSEPIGFLKIDVEGLEMEVLEGLRKTIERTRPVIMIEVADQNIVGFENFMESLSYTVEWQAAPYIGMRYFLVVPNS